MKYFLTLVLLFVSVLPAVSLSFDDAMKSSKPFLFYMYQDGCSACKYFDSIYDEIRKKYSANYNFVRQNADAAFSTRLIEKWKINAVPFVVIVNPNTSKASKIDAYCAMDKGCLEETLTSYR